MAPLRAALGVLRQETRLGLPEPHEAKIKLTGVIQFIL